MRARGCAQLVTLAIGIIDVLLAASFAVLVAGFLVRSLGVRELLFAGAPAVQLAFARRHRRTLTARDCIVLTHLGTAMLANLGALDVEVAEDGQTIML